MANLELGIQKMDQQHAELVDLVGRLIAQVKEPGPGSRFTEPMETLANKVQAHFATEGLLMRKHAYAALEKHEAAHDAFLQTFVGLRGELLEAPRSAPLADKLAPMIGGWLELHIEGFDQALARFLLEAGEM